MSVRELYANVYEATLDSGLRILVEEVPQSRSVSVGFWIRAGSREDPNDRPGLSHFLEHLAFKGTPSRDAREISEAIDAIGGHINAATAKEATFYYADVPADGLETALRILADIVFNPRLAASDVDLERNVVLEEIRGHEDDPDQTAYDLFSAGVWEHEHPYARPVIGTLDSISAASVEDLRAFHSMYYRPVNVVLVVCGAVRASEVASIAQSCTPAKATVSTSVLERIPPCFRSSTQHHEQPTALSHIYIGTQAPSGVEDDRIPLEVVNSILGDGSSSRLFRSIRETRGLAYAISSYISGFSDAGLWLTYAGVAPANVGTVVELIQAEFARIVSEPLPEDELELAKSKLRGHLILGMETNAHRASRLANAALMRRKLLSPDDLLQKLNAVTVESAHEVLLKYMHLNALNIATIGPS